MLYRHYKNKYYKSLGIAKHSETQEELMLYETRYESPGGRTWVRPKDMFLEEIEHEGMRVKRFAPVPVETNAHLNPPESELHSLGPLVTAALGEWTPNAFFDRIRPQKNVYLQKAFVDGHIAGFKIGYEIDPSTFYSWLGGVAPEWRGLGVAGLLMDQQHAWCKAQGYETVRTKTQNKYRSMLLLDIRKGFEVTGTENDSARGLKIILEKRLI